MWFSLCGHSYIYQYRFPATKEEEYGHWEGNQQLFRDSPHHQKPRFSLAWPCHLGLVLRLTASGYASVLNVTPRGDDVWRKKREILL